MRYSIFMVLVCLTWARSQIISEEENKRQQEIFGNLHPDTDLTPSKVSSTSSKMPEITEDEKTRVKNIFGITNDNATECHTKDGKAGICVLRNRCNIETGTFDFSGIIDLRQRECPYNLQVCCLQNQMKDTPSPPVVEQPECGWSNPGAKEELRILNDGTTAEFGEFPWMVAILRRFFDQTKWTASGYIGGGSIIHPQVVLTAAHKVDGKVDASDIKCRAGEWDIRTKHEMYPHQERDVKKIIQHPDYDKISLYNDVALLILETPYSLGNAPHIGVACLAPRAPPAATRCQSMGWGAEFDDSTKNAVVLKKVELPWVPRDKCQHEFRSHRFGSLFELHVSLTCAGGEAGKDTCAGDGGSPLVCPIGNGDPKKRPTRFAIFGMVAYGFGCGDPVPAAYVNVPHLYNWIGEKMAAEGFPTSSYTYKL